MRFRLTNAIALAMTLLAALLPDGAGAQTDESARARSLDLLEESAALYEEGRFEEAATLLRRAHELFPSPPLLYNLGRALESAGDPEGALEAYEGYLDAVEGMASETERRADAEARAEALRQRDAPAAEPALEAEPPVAEGPEATEPADPLSLPPPSRAPWLLLGAGSLVAAVGGVLGLVALARNGEAGADETSMADAAELHDQAEGLALGANVLLPVGGAIAIGGLLWGLLRKPSADEPTVSVSAGPGGAALRLRAHF